MMKIWGNYGGYLSAKIRNTETFSTLKLIDCVKVLRPTRHKIGLFRRCSYQPISWLNSILNFSN